MVAIGEIKCGINIENNLEKCEEVDKQLKFL